MKIGILIASLVGLIILFGGIFVMAASQYEERDGKKYLTIEDYGLISDRGQGLEEVSTHIFKGWNLIRGFANPNWLIHQSVDDSIQLTPRDILAIYAFDTSNQDYIRLSPNPDKDKLQNTQVSFDYLVSSTAFWVYSNKEADIKYFTLKLWPLEYRYQLTKGWNFVAVTPDMHPSLADTNLKDIVGNCNIEKSYFYRSDLSDWEEAPIEYAQIEENLIGSGWVIRVSNDCTLKSGSAGEVPALPGLP